MRKPSPATIAVLAALVRQPDALRYGYELMEMTGLKSGSLYPILIRLDERGLLASEWEKAGRNGRPPRHVYRLTDAGLAYAAAHACKAGAVSQAGQTAGEAR